MERVREAVELARRAARAGEAVGGGGAGAGGRRKSNASSGSQQQTQAPPTDDDGDDALAKLIRLLPDTPAEQLIASLDAASSSSAGELKVRGSNDGRESARERKNFNCDDDNFQ